MNQRARAWWRGCDMTIARLPFSSVYSGTHLNAQWYGHEVVDEDRFKSYMASRVKARAEDDEDSFAVELRGVATTGMSSEFVEKLLRAVPGEKPWAVGEALAECLLSDDDTREICWPWNLVRDRRTPRASLPGTDLVGFCKKDGTVLLLFGEVKTSSAQDTPPKVMIGSGGMTWQLGNDATRLDIHHALLKWLHARCKSGKHRELYQAAVQRYVQSQGKDVLLVGVLLRDTRPSESDVIARAKSLAESLHGQTRIEITAWYFLVPIKDWSALLHGGVS